MDPNNILNIECMVGFGSWRKEAHHKWPWLLAFIQLTLLTCKCPVCATLCELRGAEDSPWQTRFPLSRDRIPTRREHQMSQDEARRETVDRNRETKRRGGLMGLLMTLTSGLKTECSVLVPDNYLPDYFWRYSFSFFTWCAPRSDAGG